MAKTELIHLRVSTELKEQLKTAAESENRTVTNYIENLVKQALKKQKKGEED